jgi:acyl-CoA synthetase (NDP forming)
MSVVTSDMFTDRNLSLPDLEDSTVHRLKELLPDTSPGNPFDSGGQFLSSGVELLVQALNVFNDDPNLDFIVYCLMPVVGLRTKVYAQGIARASHASAKPSMVLHYRAGAITEEASAILNGAGLLTFDPPEAGIDGLQLWLSGHGGKSQPADDTKADPVEQKRAAQGRAIAADWRERSLTTVTQAASQTLLDLYGLPHGRQAMARTADAAADIAVEFGVPVVMKVESPDLPHRSDFGGVLLNVVGPEAAGRAFEKLTERSKTANPSARIQGILVAEMAEPGTELIAGIKVDPALGPAVLIGMGGTMAEIFNDVSIRLPPIGKELAEEMLRELKGAPSLFGHRGSAGVDVGALVDFLVRLGEMAVDLGHSVVAVDLNPIVAHQPGRGVEVLDVLVELPT